VQRGRELAYLGLLDAQLSPAVSGIVSGHVPLGAWWRHVAVGRRTFGWWRTLLIEASLYLAPRPAALRVVARARRALMATESGHYLERQLRMRVLARAWRLWCAGPGGTFVLEAPVFLFQAVDDSTAGPADAGWPRNCPALTIIPVSGGHATIFERPQVELLAQQFIASIQGASAT
jgi:thioesterase domain-containing protein